MISSTSFQNQTSLTIKRITNLEEKLDKKKKKKTITKFEQVG